MGQSITVDSRTVDGFCVFSTDRSLTGQDGAGFESVEAAAADPGFPGRLAARLFEADDAVDHVWVASSDVIVRRVNGWDSGSVETAATTIGDLFRFYPD
jgi:hypothetical protein